MSLARRNKRIFEQALKGKSMAELSKVYKVSRTRIQQIIQTIAWRLNLYTKERNKGNKTFKPYSTKLKDMRKQKELWFYLLKSSGFYKGEL